MLHGVFWGQFVVDLDRSWPIFGLFLCQNRVRLRLSLRMRRRLCLIPCLHLRLCLRLFLHLRFVPASASTFVFATVSTSMSSFAFSTASHVRVCLYDGIAGRPVLSAPK